MKIRPLLFSICLSFCFACLAQTSPSDKSPSMQQDSQPASLASTMNKGETTLKGCIRAADGKYFLESKGRKKAWLSGPEDFAPHIGHSVMLQGTFLSGSAAAEAMQSTGDASAKAPAKQESNFQVSAIKMVSDTCALKNSKSNKSSSDQP